MHQQTQFYKNVRIWQKLVLNTANLIIFGDWPKLFKHQKIYWTMFKKHLAKRRKTDFYKWFCSGILSVTDFCIQDWKARRIYDSFIHLSCPCKGLRMCNLWRGMLEWGLTKLTYSYEACAASKMFPVKPKRNTQWRRWLCLVNVLVLIFHYESLSKSGRALYARRFGAILMSYISITVTTIRSS